MGVFNWSVRLDGMDGRKSLEIEAMVDTGASYTIVPASLLRGLGVSPIDRMDVALADGRPVEMDIGEARATIDGRSIPTLVLFGRDDAPALLGAYTLEGLRLAAPADTGKAGWKPAPTNSRRFSLPLPNYPLFTIHHPLPAYDRRSASSSVALRSWLARR